MEADANIIKFMMENRKKYNLSCGDIIDNKPNSKSKGKDSKSCKKKSAVTANKKNNKAESKKAIKKIIVDNDGKRYKQSCLASKSKGSTSAANINLNATKQRKKGKENKENRKKKSRSRSRSKSKQQQKHGKSSKMFVLPKEDSDGEKDFREHEHEYPVNKYFNSKKKHKNLLNIRVGFDSSHNFINSEDSSVRVGRKNSENEFSWDFPKHDFGVAAY
jgi:hypothetical protein